MDQSGVIERRSNRSNVMLKATLEASGGSFPVVLRNLSQEGALIRGDDLPEAGERVLFHRQGLCVPGRIAWLHSEHAGLQFDAPLFPREMLRHVPPAGHKPPPPIARRPGLATKPLTAVEKQMIERWAAESSPYTLGE